MKNRIKEYSVITPFDEQHFDNEKDAQDFWDSLPFGIKIISQYFSKVWVRKGNDFIEDEVILLNEDY